MAKRQQGVLLNRLAGKTIAFSGKFGSGYKGEPSLKAMAEAQQGTVVEDLSAKVDYLVLPDLTAGKTVQKKALQLNGKGAAIQIIDADAFCKLAEPTDEELLALLRAGDSETLTKVRRACTFRSANLDEIKLDNIRLSDFTFVGCSFVGAELNGVRFEGATDCDFSNVSGKANSFCNIPRSRFAKAQLLNSEFTGELSSADFTGATLEECSFKNFEAYWRPNRRKSQQATAVVFAKAKLKLCSFDGLEMKTPDFNGTDLTGAKFGQCAFESATFRDATLRNVVFAECTLANTDFRNADLSQANLGDSDLSGAILTGANFKNANLRGTKFNGADLSKAKNLDLSRAVAGAIGTALTELDSVNGHARRIQISFCLRSTDGDEEVGVDSSGLKYGWGVRLPSGIKSHFGVGSGRSQALSAAMLRLANVAGNRQVLFETVDVSSTKSPKSGKELRDLVMRGIAEAFVQDIPADDVLAAKTKEFRDAQRETGAAERERRQQAKAEAEKQKDKAKKQIAKKIEKAVGKVTDLATFLKALEVRIEKPKIDKATKMLQVSGFKLFNDVTDQHVSGVVKSQTDPDLVYACRVDHDGQYACCTQNQKICGGLRGSICKHLLVVIIGLVVAGELDPT